MFCSCIECAADTRCVDLCSVVCPGKSLLNFCSESSHQIMGPFSSQDDESATDPEAMQDSDESL